MLFVAKDNHETSYIKVEDRINDNYINISFMF